MTTTHDWKALAKKRWENVPIHGDGRWAIQVIGQNSGRTQIVVLCSDEATAKSASHFYERVQRVDLMPDTPSKTCRIIADAYDASELRRERRERNA